MNYILKTIKHVRYSIRFFVDSFNEFTTYKLALDELDKLFIIEVVNRVAYI